MEAYLNCQSCGTPLNRPERLGTEKDGSKSTIYCDYCYRDGEFTYPGMTLEEMKDHLEKELQKIEAPANVLASTLKRLPNLSRWMGIPAIHHCHEWH
jgi:hypothetical protein